MPFRVALEPLQRLRVHARTEDEGGLAHVFLRLPEALDELGLFVFVPEPDFLVDPEREKPRLVPRFLSPDARFLLPDDEPPGSALATCRGARRLLWNGRGLLGRPGPQLARLLAELSRGAADRVADPSCCLAGELADSLADAAERLSGAGRGLCSPGSRGSRGSGRASQRAVEDVVQLLEQYPSAAPRLQRLQCRSRPRRD
jgi:hypothetical protein